MKDKGIIRPRWSAWYDKERQGADFNYWFPSCDEVYVNWKTTNKEGKTKLDKSGNGVFTGFEPTLKPGDSYMIEGVGIGEFPDPFSLSQPDGVHEKSKIIDPDIFTHNRTETKGLRIEEAIIYELHIGAFTPQGTYKAIIDYLPYLKSTGVNVIELMPVASFPGKRNWGYDSVHKYAPCKAYGSETDLIKLIDEIHKQGMFVILDVIYNHFGPDGNYLYPLSRKFFSSEKLTPWGDAIDFRRREVRDYFLDNAKYWLHNYRFDGLRFDAVEAIWDNTGEHIINEICRSLKTEFINEREILLTIENNNNDIKLLGPDTGSAQWDDDFHHSLHVSLTGEIDGYYIDFKDSYKEMELVLKQGFAYGDRLSKFWGNKVRGDVADKLPPYRFIHSDQNHDQIGNRAFGERLYTLTSREAAEFALALTMLAPGVPLLFMGEELFIDTPFLFFTDHNKELGRAVTEGRRKEFGKFDSFADMNIEQIPNPQAEETFLKSKIPWDKLDKEYIEKALRIVKTCSDIRKKYHIDYSISRHPKVLRKDSLFKVSFGKLILAFNLSSEEKEDSEGYFKNGLFNINFSEEKLKTEGKVKGYTLSLYEKKYS